MKIEKFIIKDENGKNIPDTNKFFSIQEKINFRSGYSFQTISVTQRFIDKLDKLECVEQEFNFDLQLLTDALINGVTELETAKHYAPVYLIKDPYDTEGNGWAITYNDGASEIHFYLRNYGTEWTVFGK